MVTVGKPYSMQKCTKIQRASTMSLRLEWERMSDVEISHTSLTTLRMDLSNSVFVIIWYLMIFVVPLQRKHIKSDISALQRLLFSVVVDMSPLSYSEVLAIYLRIRRQRFFLFTLPVLFSTAKVLLFIFIDYRKCEKRLIINTNLLSTHTL